MIDAGNNHIDGYENDLIAPRKNAAEEFRTVVYGLTGKRPLEIAVTHAHPDHDGMTSAFINKNVTFWMPEGEDIKGPLILIINYLRWPKIKIRNGLIIVAETKLESLRRKTGKTVSDDMRLMYRY